MEDPWPQLGVKKILINLWKKGKKSHIAFNITSRKKGTIANVATTIEQEVDIDGNDSNDEESSYENLVEAC